MGIQHFVYITMDTNAIYITFNLLKSRIDYSLNILVFIFRSEMYIILGSNKWAFMECLYDK